MLEVWACLATLKELPLISVKSRFVKFREHGIENLAGGQHWKTNTTAGIVPALCFRISSNTNTHLTAPSVITHYDSLNVGVNAQKRNKLLRHYLKQCALSALVYTHILCTCMPAVFHWLEQNLINTPTLTSPGLLRQSLRLQHPQLTHVIQTWMHHHHLPLMDTRFHVNYYKDFYTLQFVLWQIHYK